MLKKYILIHFKIWTKTLTELDVFGFVQQSIHRICFKSVCVIDFLKVSSVAILIIYFEGDWLASLLILHLIASVYLSVIVKKRIWRAFACLGKHSPITFAVIIYASVFIGFWSLKTV